jgi:hypothetical protein
MRSPTTPAEAAPRKSAAQLETLRLATTGAATPAASAAAAADAPPAASAADAADDADPPVAAEPADDGDAAPAKDVGPQRSVVLLVRHSAGDPGDLVRIAAAEAEVLLAVKVARPAVLADFSL